MLRSIARHPSNHGATQTPEFQASRPQKHRALRSMGRADMLRQNSSFPPSAAPHKFKSRATATPQIHSFRQNSPKKSVVPANGQRASRFPVSRSAQSQIKNRNSKSAPGGDRAFP